ncbi:hypothetical protein ACFLT9_07300 [Acidobacteriota bacterium]
MNIYQTILELEEKNRNVYRDLAQKCESNEGIRYILNMLANEQDKHIEVLSSLKGGTCSGIRSTTVFQEARKLFEGLQSDQKTFSCSLDQVQLYRDALDLVNKKLKLYSAMIDETECEPDRKTLSEIIEEERQQVIVLENIILMVSRPESWLEDAEFSHLDEY